MNIVNATPHTVNLLKEDGSVSRDFEPEVSIRVASDTTPVGENRCPVDTPKLFDGSFKNVSSIQQENSQVLVGKIGVFCPDRQVHYNAKEIGLDGPDLTKDDINLEK